MIMRTGDESMMIVIERDREAGDDLAPPQGTQKNPRLQGIRNMGVTAHLHVASSLPGARVCEHEHECDALVDAFYCEVEKWASAAKARPVNWLEARYLTSEEYNAQAFPSGVVYRLRFQVPRAIWDKDYTGASLQTGVIASVATTVKIGTTELDL